MYQPYYGGHLKTSFFDTYLNFHSGLFSFSGFLLLCIFAATTVYGQSKNNQGFAVVELFTSQGCSSCPPADRVLTKLTTEASEKEQAVFALSFHVDYWDYLGWKDPYSSAAYSDRQRRYAQHFRSSRIYTPQMIVNGKSEFVGSRENEARREVQLALNNQENIAIDLMLKPTQEEASLAIRYQLPENLQNIELNIAIVEKDASTAVRRGENKGRQLSHVNIVRVFRTVSLSQNGAGDLTLALPADLTPENVNVIAYAQHTSDMRILGATQFRPE